MGKFFLHRSRKITLIFYLQFTCFTINTREGLYNILAIVLIVLGPWDREIWLQQPARITGTSLTADV